MINAVIFDMDGVLIDTEKLLNKYWREAAAEAGFNMTRENALQIRSLAGEYAGPYLQGIFGEGFSYHDIRERRKALMNEHIAKYGIEKKDGVDETLDWLHENGFKTAVATATDYSRAESYLTQIGIYDKFDDIVCAAMVAHGKPKPDVYLYACSQINEKPGNCIAVEDSPNGVRSAYDAGLKVVMVPDLTQPDEETAGLLTAKIDSLTGLISLLEEGNL